MIENRMPPELLARLEPNPFRRPNVYVDFGGQNLLSKTTCKRCGTILTAIGTDPRTQSRRSELRDVDQRTVVLETFVSRLKTNDYAVVELEVAEDSPAYIPEGNETRDAIPTRYGIHVSTICKTCKADLLDDSPGVEMLQRLYDADLERMALEDEHLGHSEHQTLAILTKLASRRVTKVLG